MAATELRVPSISAGLYLSIHSYANGAFISAALFKDGLVGRLAYANANSSDTHLNHDGKRWELWIGSTSFDIPADAVKQITSVFAVRIDTIGKAA